MNQNDECGLHWQKIQTQYTSRSHLGLLCKVLKFSIVLILQSGTATILNYILRYTVHSILSIDKLLTMVCIAFF